ncbi:hypothetical protein V8V91_24405 [Algoriphagus halophilus]
MGKLKEQAGLSNKKWDVAMKGLSKKEVARVQKDGDLLIVQLL